MSTQPKALFLADVIDNDPRSKAHHDAAAAELRWLYASCEDYAQHKERQDQRVLALTAQRDALLRALNMAVQWVEEYASQMRAYTTSEQANADLSVIYAAIKMAEEGK